MADSSFSAKDSAGTGQAIDVRTESTNSNLRQVVVLGDPATNDGVAPVDATNGLAVDVKALPASTNTIEVVGDAAENAAVAGNPVLTGGRYDATPRTLGDGDVGALALDADGAVQVSDGGNSLTVDGTVTAELSATDNAVLDQIELNQDAQTALLTTIDADTDAIKTAVETIDNAISGTEMQVDVVAPLPAGTNAIGKLAANDGVDIGDVTLNNSLLDVGGDVAHDSADSGDPVKVGYKAYSFDGSTPQTAVAEADRVNAIADLQGIQYVQTAHPNFWHVSADYAAAQTNTTVKAAPGAGLSLFVTDIVISNGATAGNITLLDGSGGTVLFEIYPAINGGATISLKNPIKLTANTLLAITSTTVTTHSVFVSGFIA